jgi:predicted aspartyl protease
MASLPVSGLLRKTTWIGLLIFAASVIAGETSAMKTLYEQHRWFELRDALKSSKNAPALYSGAVASAFNDVKKAEKDLNRAIEIAPNSEDAAEAHEMLGYLYARSGRYHEVIQQLDWIEKIKPGRSDIENIRKIYAAFSKHPDQFSAGQRSTSVRASVSREGVVLPVTIHGRTVHWLLDTDFNISAMSESEARSLGVVVDEVSAQAGDGGGGATKVRTAVVDDLAIGNTHVHSVGFLIVPDSQPPMDGLRLGRRGLVGFPVVFALQAIAWKSDGTFEIGFAPGRQSTPVGNLFLDGLSAVTRVKLEDHELDFILDTGNLAGTQLWKRFADDFGDLVKLHGAKRKQTVTEVGGSNEREVIVLPKIQLRVGGLDATLRSAPVFSKPVGDDFHHGLLGMDLLSQAREVRIDFRSMALQLDPGQRITHSK